LLAEARKHDKKGKGAEEDEDDDDEMDIDVNGIAEDSEVSDEEE
jgi:hypothetical protein